MASISNNNLALFTNCKDSVNPFNIAIATPKILLLDGSVEYVKFELSLCCILYVDSVPCYFSCEDYQSHHNTRFPFESLKFELSDS